MGVKAGGNSLAVFQKLFHINLNNYLNKTVSVRSAQPGAINTLTDKQSNMHTFSTQILAGNAYILAVFWALFQSVLEECGYNGQLIRKMKG